MLACTVFLLIIVLRHHCDGHKFGPPGRIIFFAHKADRIDRRIIDPRAYRSSNNPHRRITGAMQLLAQCKSIHDNIDLEGFGRINIGLYKAVQELIQNRSLIAISDTLFYQTARMWFKILTDDDWAFEIDNLVEEMCAIRRYLDAGDLESVGYVRRNHLSYVARKLDAETTNALAANDCMRKGLAILASGNILPDVNQALSADTTGQLQDLMVEFWASSDISAADAQKDYAKIISNAD